MPAIVDIQTAQVIALTACPVRYRLADGEVVQFDKIGDEQPEHTPRYRLVEVIEATPRPDYPAVEAASPATVYDTTTDKVVVRRTFAPDQDAFAAAIEQHIESVARKRGYSSAVACATYATDPRPDWSADAREFITWRSVVWSEIYATLAEVQAGKRPVPTIDELLAELPAIEWPQG